MYLLLAATGPNPGQRHLGGALARAAGSYQALPCSIVMLMPLPRISTV